MDATSSSAFRVNGISVDVAAGTLRDKQGNDVALRPQAFALLRYMAENAGRAVSKDELMRAVWPNVFVTDDSIVQAVRDVRRALRDDKQSVLKALHKRGYRLDVPDPQASGTRPRFSSSIERWRRLLAPTAALGALLLVAGAIAWQAAPPAATSLPLVAVLPFDTIGGDADAARLADGLTEDIITDLSRFPEFEVVGSNSSSTYRDRADDLRAVVDELGADFVVQGSIQREAERVRIAAQLVEGATGKHLWSSRWDREAADIFAIQTEIAEAVSNRLGGGAGLIQETGRNNARRK